MRILSVVGIAEVVRAGFVEDRCFGRNGIGFILLLIVADKALGDIPQRSCAHDLVEELILTQFHVDRIQIAAGSILVAGAVVAGADKARILTAQRLHLVVHRGDKGLSVAVACEIRQGVGGVVTGSQEHDCHQILCGQLLIDIRIQTAVLMRQ